MSAENIGLLKALTAKMNYLDERQKTIAQNIANADSPGYQPRDIVNVDFEGALRNVTKSNIVRPARTNPAHMPGVKEIVDPKERDQRKAYETAPVGNAVILEEQMIKSNQTSLDYNLMTSLYQKNINMLRTAIGRGQ